MSEPEQAATAAGGGLLAGAIARPVTVVVAVILVMLFGGLSVSGLPIQLTPDLSSPQLDITTAWPGGTPAEIEAEILTQQEEALEDLPGLVEMKATARADQARLALEFEVGTDLELSLVRVANRLAQVGDYPLGAREPVINTSDSTGPPLAVITVQAVDGREVAPFRTWVADRAVPQIQRVRGVGSVRHVGGRDTEIHVDLDPAALAARGLSLPDVIARVRESIRDVPAGSVTLGKRRFLVRTPLLPEELSGLGDVVLRAAPGEGSVRLRDVGTVRLGLAEPTGVARTNGLPSMILLLNRESGTNVLEVTRALRAEVERLDREMFAPEGLRIEVISDQVGYIEGALELVEQNLALGAFLAVLVLFLFLRSFGASAVVSVAIPACVMATALAMNSLGRSVNVVSLAGITFAVGMVLDNSIVVLEAIDAARAGGTPVREAALIGVRKVWGAVLASTLTTVAVFLPIIFWEGEVGQLLRDVAVAVTFAVVSSLFVSVLVVPSLAARLVGRTKAEASGPLARFGGALRDRVAGMVASLVRRPLVAGLTALLLSVATGYTAFASMPALEYLPTGNRNLIFGFLITPPGTSVDELDRVGDQMREQIVPHIGQSHDGAPPIRRSFFVAGTGFVVAGAVAERNEDVDAILPVVRRIHGSVPGFFGATNKASLFGRSAGGSRGVTLRLVGGDEEALTPLSLQLFGALRQAFPGAQVRPIPGLDTRAPELQLEVDRVAAARAGVRPVALGQLLDARVDGTFVGEISFRGSPALDVRVRARADGEEAPEAPELIMNTPVSTGAGETTLAALATLEEALGPTVLQRIEGERAVELVLSPPDGMRLEDAIAKVERDVVAPLRDRGALPPGVRIETRGAGGKLDDAAARFGGTLLLAVIICYLLLAALFEDLDALLAVLGSLPLAAAGGMLSLVAVDEFGGGAPLDLMTAMGFLILIGVVVNNAILIVDGALVRRREGAEMTEALTESVRDRVRPIFMTTATSLAGLLPMVVAPGAGSELYRGIGAIVLGGLALSSVLTLIVVPCLYAVVGPVPGLLRRALGRSG